MGLTVGESYSLFFCGFLVSLDVCLLLILIFYQSDDVLQNITSTCVLDLKDNLSHN